MKRLATGGILSLREMRQLSTLLGHLQNFDEGVIECHTVDGEAQDADSIQIVAQARRRWKATEALVKQLSKGMAANA